MAFWEICAHFLLWLLAHFSEGKYKSRVCWMPQRDLVLKPGFSSCVVNKLTNFLPVFQFITLEVISGRRRTKVVCWALEQGWRYTIYMHTAQACSSCCIWQCILLFKGFHRHNLSCSKTALLGRPVLWLKMWTGLRQDGRTMCTIQSYQVPHFGRRPPTINPPFLLPFLGVAEENFIISNVVWCDVTSGKPRNSMVKPPSSWWFLEWRDITSNFSQKWHHTAHDASTPMSLPPI